MSRKNKVFLALVRKVVVGKSAIIDTEFDRDCFLRVVKFLSF